MIQGKRSFCKLSGQCVFHNLTLSMLEGNIIFHEKNSLQVLCSCFVSYYRHLESSQCGGRRSTLI